MKVDGRDFGQEYTLLTGPEENQEKKRERGGREVKRKHPRREDWRRGVDVTWCWSVEGRKEKRADGSKEAKIVLCCYAIFCC